MLTCEIEATTVSKVVGALVNVAWFWVRIMLLWCETIQFCQTAPPQKKYTRNCVNLVFIPDTMSLWLKRQKCTKCGIALVACAYHSYSRMHCRLQQRSRLKRFTACVVWIIALYFLAFSGHCWLSLYYSTHLSWWFTPARLHFTW